MKKVIILFVICLVSGCKGSVSFVFCTVVCVICFVIRLQHDKIKMSVANLCLRAQTVYTLVQMPISTLGSWWATEKIVPSEWQRSRRWNPSDAADWITGVLQNVPVVPFFLHELAQPDGTFHYHVVDGQNRLHSLAQFLLRQAVSVSAGEVLQCTVHPHRLMTFQDFSSAQQTYIAATHLPVCIFPAITTQHELRRVFRSLNKVKPLTSQEIIHSWTHLPLVQTVINYVDTLMAGRLHAVRPIWRAHQHRLNHSWIRILASLVNRNLYLSNADAVEHWASVWGHYALLADQKDLFFQAIEKTVRVVEMWYTHNTVYSVATLADIGWGFVYCPACPIAILGTDLMRKIEHHNMGFDLQHWQGGSALMAFDTVHARRENIRQVILEWQPDFVGPLGPVLRRAADIHPALTDNGPAADALSLIPPQPPNPPPAAQTTLMDPQLPLDGGLGMWVLE